MTGRAISRVWASGIAAGAAVYVAFDWFGIGHPVAFGIFAGAVTVGYLLILKGDE